MFPGAGQNIAGNSIQGTNVDFQNPLDVIKSSTMSWFNEFSDCDMSVIKSSHGSGDPKYKQI